VVAALKLCLERYPGRAVSLHADNGSEFMNEHLLCFCHTNGIPSLGLVPITRMTIAPWRARTGPSYAGAWDTAGSIRKVSSLISDSWKHCLLAVPLCSSPPWPSSRRYGQGSTPRLGPKGSGGARSRRGTKYGLATWPPLVAQDFHPLDSAHASAPKSQCPLLEEAGIVHNFRKLITRLWPLSPPF
jgi:hypothetical protein